MSRLVWTAPVVVATPRGRVALRASTDALLGLLSDAIPHGEAAGEALPRGFGLRGADHSSSFHWLYWGGCPVVRTRDADRVVLALEQHLSAPAAPDGDDLLVRLPVGVSASGEAVLLPPLGAEMATTDRRLRAAGLRVVDSPLTLIDPHAGQVVVGHPAIGLRPDARRRLVDHLGTTRREEVVPPGRYPLRWWLMGQRPATAGTAADVARLLFNLAAPTTQSGLSAGISLVEHLRSVSVDVRNVGTLVNAVRILPINVP